MTSAFFEKSPSHGMIALRPGTPPGFPGSPGQLIQRTLSARHAIAASTLPASSAPNHRDTTALVASSLIFRTSPAGFATSSSGVVVPQRFERIGASNARAERTSVHADGRHDHT